MSVSNAKRVKELLVSFSLLVFSLVILLSTSVLATTITLSTTPSLEDVSTDSFGQDYVVQGDTFTVKITVTNPSDSSSSASNVVATINLPSGLTTTDSLTKTVSSSLSPGSSAYTTWSVRGETSGNYQGQITITTKGDNTAESSDTTGLLVKAPASIIGGVYCTVNDEILANHATTVTARIENMGDLPAYNINVSLSSNVSVSGADTTKTITSLDGGSTSEQSWSITTSSTGPISFTCSASSSNAGSDSYTVTATVVSALSTGQPCTANSQCASECCYNYYCSESSNCNNNQNQTPSSTSEASSPATTTGNLTPVKITKIWETLEKGTTQLFLVSSELSVVRLSMNIKKQMSNARVVVEKLLSKPESTSSINASVYQFFSVTHNIPDDVLGSVTIYFKVSRDWFENNNIKPENIVLFRYYNDYWTELPTYQDGFDSEFYYYKASSSGFSYFAIVGKKSGEENVVEQPPSTEEAENVSGTPEKEQTKQQGKKSEEESGKEKKSSRMWLILPLILMVLVIMFFIYKFYKARPSAVIVENKNQQIEQTQQTENIEGRYGNM